MEFLKKFRDQIKKPIIKSSLLGVTAAAGIYASSIKTETVSPVQTPTENSLIEKIDNKVDKMESATYDNEDDEEEIKFGKLETKLINGKRALMNKEPTKKEIDYANYVFKTISLNKIKEIEEAAKHNGIINKDIKLTDAIDMYHLIWTIYGEASKAVRYSKGLKQEIEDKKSEIDNMNLLMTSKNKNEIRNLIITKKTELEKLLLKKEKEKEIGDKKVKAERLAIILNVLDRALDPHFPATISANILKKHAYSSAPKFGNLDETYNLKYFVEIGDLVGNFVLGKTPLEARSKIKKEISKILNISENKIPDRLTMYSTLKFVNGDFNSDNTKTSLNTRKRVLSVKPLIEGGKIKGFEVGAHYFHQNPDTEIKS